MADPHSQLHGSCACERNQYTILVPTSSASQAQVFFDNSAANRRSQATPLTAWLRIPLQWYHSQTFALFPDETHTSIRRTFHTTDARHGRGANAGGESSNVNGGGLSVTRRQFCGYCGTHLSAWDEAQQRGEGEGEGEWMDVTLGSLLEESLRELEVIGMLGDSSSDDNDDEAAVDDEPDAGARDVAMANTIPAPSRRRSPDPSAPMRNRGIPYFESMVGNSRLGRIKRQKGGHTSRDGRTTVHWEIVEIGGVDEDEGEEAVAAESANKRPRLEP